MDLKTVREQIINNLERFEPGEKKVIIQQLLDFLKDAEAEKADLNRQLEELTKKVEAIKAENEALKADSFEEEKIKRKIDYIIDKAEEEAHRIIEQAENKGELHLEEVKEQGRLHWIQFLNRLEQVVIELQKLDEESKAYRLHILTFLKRTLFRFSDSDYHVLRLDDEDFKELLQFYKDDEELQGLSEKINDKLKSFEGYLEISHHEGESDADIEGLESMLQAEDDVELEEEEKLEESTYEKFIDIFNYYSDKQDE